MNKLPKVFLGGTCNNSTWREELIKLLDPDRINYFNPVVDDWNEDAQEQELLEREYCDFVLYVITPEMLGTYSIAEVTDDSNKRPGKTIFCVTEECSVSLFEKHAAKSLEAVKELVSENGAKVLSSLTGIADYLNNYAPEIPEISLETIQRKLACEQCGRESAVQINIQKEVTDEDTNVVNMRVSCKECIT